MTSFIYVETFRENVSESVSQSVSYRNKIALWWLLTERLARASPLVLQLLLWLAVSSWAGRVCISLWALQLVLFVFYESERFVQYDTNTLPIPTIRTTVRMILPYV